MRFLRTFDAERRLFGAATMATELQGIAVDTALLLAHTRPPDVVLDELSRALDDVGVGDVDRFITGESTSRFNALRGIIDGRSWSVGGLLMRPIVRHHLAGMMQVTADAREAARLPWPARIAAMNAIPEDRSILHEIPRFVGAWRLQSAFRDLVPRVGIGTSAARCARLVIEIERYRRTRGVLPQRLDNLGWSGPVEALIDPFTGKPLQYVATSDGYALYSVGPDLTDDNAKVFPQQVNGHPSGTGPTPDIGVVLSVKAPRSN
jgi:hypothetical protein